MDYVPYKGVHTVCTACTALEFRRIGRRNQERDSVKQQICAELKHILFAAYVITYFTILDILSAIKGGRGA